MASRLDLQEFLENLLGSRNVYFQPPTSVKMNYPAIVYKRIPGVKLPANDSAYVIFQKYEIVVIDRNPDSEFFEKLLVLPECSFQRSYASDNLNHWVFNLFY